MSDKTLTSEQTNYLKEHPEWSRDDTYNGPLLEPFQIRWLWPNGTIHPIGSCLCVGGAVTVYWKGGEVNE